LQLRIDEAQIGEAQLGGVFASKAVIGYIPQLG
jgi:hypothetical protein